MTDLTYLAESKARIKNGDSVTVGQIYNMEVCDCVVQVLGTRFYFLLSLENVVYINILLFESYKRQEELKKPPT